MRGRGAGPWLAAFLLLLCVPLRARPAEGRPGKVAVLDGVVAMLDEALITRSDLVFEARVEALRRRGAEGLGAAVDEPLLAATLERSLAERLHSREAELLGVVPLGLQERERLVEHLEARVGGPHLLEAFLGMHGADRAQLAALLERRERAERALESRVRVRAQVTEAEVRRHHEADATRSGRPYAEVRDALLAELREERAREVAARERERLFGAARVRRIAPWAREGRRSEPEEEAR